MLDIGVLNNHMIPGEAKERIDKVQVMGRRLAHRVAGIFTLVGHRAVQLEADNGDLYHALVHNEADDPTDYLVIHPVGQSDRLFDAAKIEEAWTIRYVEMEHYDQLMDTSARMILEHANIAYAKFIETNYGCEAEPLTEKDLNLDSFSESLSKMDLTLTHEGNMRLAF